MDNYAYALYKQAQKYRYGWDGVKKDIKLAINLYKKSAEAGYKPAFDRLKELADEIQERRLEEAQLFKDIITKARSGSVEDIYKIGFVYEFGKYGMPVNKKEACNWYRIAAQKGNPYASYRLELLEKLLKAENKSELMKAYYEKGYCYEHGVGVKVDKTFAIEMYSKAAEMNYEPAKESLKRLNNNMSYERFYNKNCEDSMRWSNNNLTKSSKVNFSKALVVYQERTVTSFQDKPLDINQMLQIQLYLKHHPVLKEDDVCKMEYMYLLEVFLKECLKKDKWKNSLLGLYQKVLIKDLSTYRSFKSKMAFPKYYKMKGLLLTDSLFIGAFADKGSGFEVLKKIAQIRGDHDALDEYIFKSFYSEEPVLNFDKKFPELFDIYKTIWHNRQFLKKPIKIIMITANMSAGKSTLLNALVGKKVNKMQNEVCTAKRHYLYNKAGEDGFNYEFDYDLELDATEEILMTDNEKNKSKEICVGTRFFSIFDLDKRICFIDTPGVNSSLDRDHREIAESVISSEKCDLLIYLLNAENIGTDEDYKHLTYVKENYSGKIIFLVNKLDHFQRGVDSVKETLKKVKNDLTSLGFKNVDVYPISAYAAYLGKRKLSGYKLNDEELYELGYLTLKLNSQEFNYDSYFHLQELKNIFLNNVNAELQQLLIHSGIVALEQIIYCA